MINSLTSPLREFVQARLERRDFARASAISCETAQLVQGITHSDLEAIFCSDQIGREWSAAVDRLAEAGIDEAAVGGVNPGDRRAIFYLIRHFEPKSVLEIGTHIGASTMHIACALGGDARQSGGGAAVVTTVDIVDVNDPREAPWSKHGSAYAPLEIARRLGVAERVEFVVGRSLEHLAGAGPKYDFIFLDGDHSARTVYQEIPAALRALRPNGVILLHDYFPRLRPLWPDGTVIPGPWRAVERIRAEGGELEALPLGELPWPTKLGTRSTSLALLVRSRLT